MPFRRGGCIYSRVLRNSLGTDTSCHGSQVGGLGDWSLEVILTFSFGTPTTGWLAARPFQLSLNLKCTDVLDGVLQLLVLPEVLKAAP